MEDDQKDKSLREVLVSRVLDQLPAAKASAVKVTVGVPELQLERTTGFHEVSQDGQVDVDSAVDLQLAAPEAAMELRVRSWLTVWCSCGSSLARRTNDGCLDVSGRKAGCRLMNVCQLSPQRCVSALML